MTHSYGSSFRSTSCLCICHYVAGASCDDAVCASATGGGAAPQQLVARPVAPTLASSHRTTRTAQPSFPIATPLGPTTAFRL
ncbi:MAG TPA: hypothetical protein VFB99_01640 [Vicinamibacterales bacterium]|nr:hypothetical protein [Vicinamibacterales bacterium]